MRITNWIIEKCEIESANYVRMEKETYPPPPNLTEKINLANGNNFPFWGFCVNSHQQKRLTNLAIKNWLRVV